MTCFALLFSQCINTFIRYKDALGLAIHTKTNKSKTIDCCNKMMDFELVKDYSYMYNAENQHILLSYHLTLTNKVT
jgi:hypothetical protein